MSTGIPTLLERVRILESTLAKVIGLLADGASNAKTGYVAEINSDPDTPSHQHRLLSDRGREKLRGLQSEFTNTRAVVTSAGAVDLASNPHADHALSAYREQMEAWS